MVVTIANRKGGVGKTTCAFNLGFTYALQKRQVLFIDLDSQANLSLLCKAAPLDLEAWKAGAVQPVGKGVVYPARDKALLLPWRMRLISASTATLSSARSFFRSCPRQTLLSSTLPPPWGS